MQVIRDNWAVAIGYLPLGFAFGALMTQAGFQWYWTPIFSIVIYAGSMEFLALSMVTAGTGPLSAALAAFMVNFRHIFYGLTFPRDSISSPWGRAYSVYALTDEAYAILSGRHDYSGRYVLGTQVFLHALWVGSGIIGALAPLPTIAGLEFALAALFIALAVEAYRANPNPVLLVAAAVLALLSPSLILALVGYFLLALIQGPRAGRSKIIEVRDA